MTIRTLTFLHVLSVLLLCAPVSAQPSAADLESGRRHFDRGVEYYRDGNINAALIEFKRAYAAAPNYRVLFNLGQVSNALSDYTAAQSYFQKYLHDGGDEIDSARRRDVETTLGKLAGRITTLSLSCNVEGAELFVDDTSVGKSPLREPVRVSAGTRHLAAMVPGRPRVTRVIEAAGGETLSVKLELAPAPHELSPMARSTPATSTVTSSGPGASLWLGIATGALAVGGGVMGTLAAIDGSKYHDALHRMSTPGEINSLHDRAQTKGIVTDILLGATVVTGAITVVMLLSEGGEDRAPQAARPHAAQLSFGAGSLQLTSRFD
jgi:hypothetical protein